LKGDRSGTSDLLERHGKSMENQWKTNGTSWKINGTSWTIENHGKLWKVIGGYLFSDGQIL